MKISDDDQRKITAAESYIKSDTDVVTIIDSKKTTRNFDLEISVPRELEASFVLGYN